TEALSPFEPGLKPLTISAYVGRLSGNEQIVPDPAARAQQTGSRKVGNVHHEPWRQIHELSAAIGLMADDARNLESQVADLKPVSEAGAQRAKQRVVDPYRARQRAAFDKLARV